MLGRWDVGIFHCAVRRAQGHGLGTELLSDSASVVS